MATRGSCISLSSDKRESLMCSLCLDIFREPKLLPCSHTFCKKCLEDLIQRHPGGSFPCPACRKDIEVPSGGASGFQNNISMDEEELETARNNTLCSIHLDRNLEMFCLECDILICTDCKQGVHLHHKTQILQGAKKDGEEQLSRDTVRLMQMKKDIENMMPEWRTNRDEFKAKKAAIERKIRHRHATLVAEADKYLKEALESLEEACSDTENMLSTKLQTVQDNVDTLQNLQQKIDTAVENAESCEMVNVAKEVRTGCGSQEKLKKMEIKPVKCVSRPVHRADLPTDDAMFVSMRNFIGTGELQTYDYVDPEVTVTEETQCGEHEDSLVFCVCPGETATRISFESSYKDKEPCMKEFPTTSELELHSKHQGPHSYRLRKDDQFIMTPHSLGNTYVKCSTSDKHYRLTTSFFYHSKNMMLDVVVTDEPFKTNNTWLFSVDCGSHRAVDVNSTEELFAVVKNPQAKDKLRQVKLFRWQQKEAVDTYQSPLTSCQPADVCFFTLAGEEVLLIADEANDAIHVVKIRDERLTFSRFLAPGCPVLVQPTALNTDPRGRLWVGCRGGALLTVEPVTKAVAATTVDDGDGDGASVGGL